MGMGAGSGWASAGRGPQRWIIQPISISGKVHVNVGVFIKAPSRFDFPHLIVADLVIEPIRIALSNRRRRPVATSATLTLMRLIPLRHATTKVWSARGYLRAAVHAVRMTLITVSPSTRLMAAIRDRSSIRRRSCMS